MMTRERSTRIVNSMTPRDSGAKVWPYTFKSYSENALSSTLSIYSTLIAIMLRDYDAAFRYLS